MIPLPKNLCLNKMLFQIGKSKLYQKLFESFKKSHTNTKVQNVQKLVNEVWRNYK